MLDGFQGRKLAWLGLSTYQGRETDFLLTHVGGLANLGNASAGLTRALAVLE